MDYSTCSNCGKTVLKGAMRCTSCGKILISAEDQRASIEKLQKSRKGFNVGRLIKAIIIAIALAFLYRSFGDAITDFIRSVLNN